MGASLPKVVDSTVVERYETKNFRVACGEMNGWRNSMEDSHLAFFQDDWGFFGVFDGHGGDACSTFVAPRLKRELEENGCPADDAAVKKMLFAIDKEFLDKEVASGSTATMCIVNKPKEKGGKHKLRVINAGDSRVLLGKLDGTIVDGGGTDEGLTTDHKPDHPVERERIYRCGGTVEHQEGNCPRVNGDLAVCRGFGDREYKKTGGPGPEDRPVTIDPELKEFECDEADFLLLVCDGVSEGTKGDVCIFPNRQVVELAAKVLKETNSDLGAVTKAICHKAVATDSKDNISCMIVLFDGAEKDRTDLEFLPGQVENLGHNGYRKAYVAMAEKAGCTLAEAVEKRHDLLQASSSEELAKLYAPASSSAEADKIGTPAGSKGSDERSKWFQKWVDNLPEEKEEGPGGMDLSSLMGDKGAGKGGKGGKGGAMGGGGKGAPMQEKEEVVEKDEKGYSWSQDGDEVQITCKLQKNATKKDVKVGFKTKTLDVTVHGDSILSGPLAGDVEVDECTWCLVGGGSELQVMLTKSNAKDKWKTIVK